MERGFQIFFGLRLVAVYCRWARSRGPPQCSAARQKCLACRTPLAGFDSTDWRRSSPSFSEKLVTAHEKMTENLPGND